MKKGGDKLSFRYLSQYFGVPYCIGECEWREKNLLDLWSITDHDSHDKDFHLSFVWFQSQEQPHCV